MEEKWRKSQEVKDDGRRKDRESAAMVGKRNFLVCGEKVSLPHVIFLGLFHPAHAFLLLYSEVYTPQLSQILTFTTGHQSRASE